MNLYKIILGVIAVIICTFTGVKLSEKYKLRKDFYSKLLNFNRLFLEEVSFSKNTLPKIIEKISDKEPFGRFAKEYFNFLVNNGDSNEYKYLWFLSSEELSSLKNYFSALGKTDAKTQVDFLKSKDEKLKETLKLSEIDEKKYRTLYLKMGFFTGLLILVLIL